MWRCFFVHADSDQNWAWFAVVKMPTLPPLGSFVRLNDPTRKIGLLWADFDYYDSYEVVKLEIPTQVLGRIPHKLQPKADYYMPDSPFDAEEHPDIPIASDVVVHVRPTEVFAFPDHEDGEFEDE